MKRIATIAALSALCASAGTAAAGEIDLGLQEVLDDAAPNDIVSTLVYLNEQADVESMVEVLRDADASRQEQYQMVVASLRDTAEQTQANLRADLQLMEAAGEVQNVQPFWITNAIRVDAAPDVIAEIAERADVQRVYFNPPIESINPVEDKDERRGKSSDPLPAGAGSIEPGVDAVNAPDVWAMGYTGEGTLISSLDTGVDGNHPALGDRWRGNDPAYSDNPEWAWFDPVTETTFPQAWGSHGTHTMGSAAGSAPGNEIGVAPGAEWIHAGVIDRISIEQTVADAILSFEWVTNPDGDPSTMFDVPDVCFNSWGVTSFMGYPNCDDLFWSYIDNTEAAGVVVLFSAGNEGTSGLRRPADRATDDFRNMAVAAVDGANPNWPLAGFSSQGPTFCTPDGSEATKPDISAPGVDIRSAMDGGGYGQMSGTSMASPHIAGVVSLMRQACPDLTPDEIKQIIYDTAVDLGSSGKNNQYGYGMIDALEAVILAEGNCGLSIRLPNGAPNLVDPGEDLVFEVEILEGQENVVPGSETLYYRYGDSGAFQSAPLIELEDGLYEAVVPAADCGETPQYYVEAEGDEGSVRTNPYNAPETVHSALVGEFVTDEVYAADFSSGSLPSGWSADGLWNVGSACPVNGDCQGPNWAYYGQAGSCNYETGGQNDGEMLSAPIQIPDVPQGGTVELSFCYNLETEAASAYDVATFSVVGGLSQELSDSGQWTTHTVNITQMAGETITLSWEFDTIDGLFNDFRGLQVDNIRIDITTLECEDEGITGDLNGDGVVNGADLGILLSAWGPCDNPNDCPADLDGDGTVGGADLGTLLSNWSE